MKRSLYRCKSWLCVLLACLCLACAQNEVRVARVLDNSGEPLAGVVVQLVVVDDQGAVVATLDTAVSDFQGMARLALTGRVGSAVLFRALIPSGERRAFAAQIFDVTAEGTRIAAATVDTLSEALVRAVIYVTETPGGRSLGDFSEDEIGDLAVAARDRLADLTDLDLNDIDQVVARTVTLAGRDIADAAGGIIGAASFAGVTGPNVVTAGPLFDRCSGPSCYCSRDFAFVTAEFFKFDLKEDGGLCNVEAALGPERGAFSGGMRLEILGDTFNGRTDFPGDDSNPSTPVPAVATEDGREVVYGPVTSDGGLKVTRKLWVFEDSDLVRYTEVLQNPQSSAATVGIRISGDLGLTTARLLTVEAGSVFDTAARWGAFSSVIPNSSTPTVGFVIGGLTHTDDPELVSFPPEQGAVSYLYAWQDIALAAGATATFVHYVLVSKFADTDRVRALLEEVQQNPPMQGFSAAEINGLRNMPPSVGNVVGEAGSVVSFETLALTPEGGAAQMVRAARDGSFRAAVDAPSGSRIAIVGDAGTDTAAAIP